MYSYDVFTVNKSWENYFFFVIGTPPTFTINRLLFKHFLNKIFPNKMS